MRWQYMPERYGMYKSTHKRFTRWASTVEGARQSDDVRVVHGQHTDRKKEGKADRANTRSVRRSAAKLPLL